MQTTSHPADDIENPSPVEDDDANDRVEKFYSKHVEKFYSKHVEEFYSKHDSQRTRAIISKARPLVDLKATQLRLAMAKALLPIETSIGSISLDILEKIAREIKPSTFNEVINRTSKDLLNNHLIVLKERRMCAVTSDLAARFGAIALGFVFSTPIIIILIIGKVKGAYLPHLIIYQLALLAFCLLSVCSSVSGRLKPFQDARRLYEQDKSDHEKLIAAAKPGSTVSTVFRQKNGEVKKPGNNHSRCAIM